MLLEFSVVGEPAPQGSKTRLATGGMREDNPAIAPWRSTVAAKAAAAMGSTRPLLDEGGPLRLVVTFVFARPKSHYRTGRRAGELRDSAPIYCGKRPDLDKLVRAVGDALTGIVVQDDAAFVELAASKRYGQPGAQIMIKRAH